jgi:hypothetical protein
MEKDFSKNICHFSFFSFLISHFIRDNIFIFHLSDKSFWQLPLDAKVQNCSAIKFVPQQKNLLLVANKAGFIYEIEISE